MKMENHHLALRGDFRRNEPMSQHTTWRVGGMADRAYIPSGLDDLAQFLKTLPDNEPLYVVGLGSNLLVRDGGIRGTVIFTHGALCQLKMETDNSGLVYAEAGVASPRLARFVARHDLNGAEFLAGIPGTVGGALAMNAGCYGEETWGVVDRVLMFGRDGLLRQRAPADFTIGYRNVRLRPEAEAALSVQEWFGAAWFRMPRGDGQTARQKIRELLARRVASQPLGQPNAGSVFRNPPGDHAARLIEECGLKGKRVGGAMISPRHANFIINTGGARAADIEGLIGMVREVARKKCNVDLVPEVQIVGEESSVAER